MRTKRIYQGIALLAVALTTAACQNELKEESSEPKPGEKVNMTIRATQGTAPQTRTSYEDKLGVTGIDEIVVKWEEGADGAPVEKIKVFGYDVNDMNYSVDFSSKASSINSDGTSITFEGTIDKKDHYLAMYPADKSRYDDGVILTSFLNQIQDCNNPMAHLKGFDFMVGTPITAGNYDNFTFDHRATMIRFVLDLSSTTEKIATVSLSSTKQLYSEVFTSADATGGTTEVDVQSPVSSLDLAITNHTSSTKPLKAYMMMPPFDASNDVLTITVNTESGKTYTGDLTTGADTKLEAKLCYTLKPTLTLSNIVTVPPVKEGELKAELDKITSLDPKQTELVLTGTVNADDIIALATFLKNNKAKSITTLDLSGITGTTEVKGLAACAKITTVVLPDEAEAIGDNAFEGCTALTTVIQKETAPAANTRASMPSRVKTVGNEAFKNCTSMTEMFLHANITSVGNNAFDGCTALTALVFEGTKSVGSEDANLKLGTDIVANTHADLKIFLPAIKADVTATTYKTDLEKPIYYNFAGYGSAAAGDKVKPTNYTLLPHGNGIGGLTPGGEWGK